MNFSNSWSPDHTDPALDFPVVAIGASAGGLEAVTEVVQNISENTGLAYVLIFHLDPNHESLMAELLARKTNLAVRQIEDGDAVQPDQLHVIPPGYSLRLEDGAFRLEPFEEPRGLRRPIDSFFASLAHTQGPRSASVILSGTGADGSTGMRAIKEMGGVCVAQLPEEARYDGMPHAALATKLVDFALPADQIVERLVSYFDGRSFPHLAEDFDEIEEPLARMFQILQDETGHDFSGYKRGTILRRLERRLQVFEFTSLDHYVEYLKNSPDERRAIFQDFLINVTSFFRDEQNFHALRTRVLEPLLRSARFSDEVRIWVPGCSTGQEAYSIAMIVDEICETLEDRPIVQIFGTDIDDQVIDMAREGKYPATAMSEIPKRYQESYTVGHDGMFEIAPRIRHMVRFSIHSLIKDAPFSKIDLISCRNLLIYLDEKLQNEVLPIFHFSLKPGGSLFLGNSESVTRRSELYDDVDARHRIFIRRETGKRSHVMLPLGEGTSSASAHSERKTAKAHQNDGPRSMGVDAIRATIYESYAPPFVRVAEDGRIVDSSGDLSLFLMSRPGDEHDIYALLRDGLSNVVMPLLTDAKTSGQRRALSDINVLSQFGTQKTDVIAHPLNDGTIAIVFNARGRLSHQIQDYSVEPPSQDQRISNLQDDLQATRLLLKSKVEEVETTNEELKSSNEEMMSMNEELQSANEELTTANEELKNKIDELSLANTDLANFMQSSALIMVVLDRSYRIRHLTEAAKHVLPLRSTDRGRAITEFRINLKNVDLPRAISSVFETAETFEQQTASEDGSQHFLLRITPYFYGDGSIEGATITLVDLTEIKVLQDDLHVESERLTMAMAAGRMGHIDLDTKTGLVTVDQMLSEQFGLDGPGQVSKDVLLQHVDREHIDEIDAALDKAANQNNSYELTFPVKIPGQDERWIRTIGLPHQAQDGEIHVVGPTIDVTAEHQEMVIQELTHQELNHRIKNLFAVINSIVTVAPKPTNEVEEYSDALQARISALSRAYDLAGNKGRITGVSFRELLERILAPHSSRDQIVLDGADVTVSSENLTTFTLMLHEMATNAMKYGAFSKEGGRLSVSWRISADQKVQVDWKESVPDFEASKTEGGFGSRMIKLAAKQLRGEIEQALLDDGMKIRFSFRATEAMIEP